MVFIIPPSPEPDLLRAYLMHPLSDTELRALKQRFERAGALRFNPAVEMVIERSPKIYETLSHAEIRQAENSAGREEAFVIIDAHAKESQDSAVWYVSQFADEDMVESGIAESTDVLLEMLVRIDLLPTTHINDEAANQTIDEVLEQECGVETPFKTNFRQPRVYGWAEDDKSGEYARGEQYTEAECFAEPGEYEESTDPELLDDMSPRPDVVVRLKRDAAEGVGLVFGGWFWREYDQSTELPDGTTKTFPNGTVKMNCIYDIDFPWPEYKWPEDSL